MVPASAELMQRVADGLANGRIVAPPATVYTSVPAVADVPMVTTVADCEKICQLVADTGLKYMMAETVVYSREFLFIRDMYRKGEFGKIQYLQASHPQDMDGWPDYWERMIPMHYATHVVSPVLGLMDKLAEYVSCFGSGAVHTQRRRTGSRMARLASGMSAVITMSLAPARCAIQSSASLRVLPTSIG